MRIILLVLCALVAGVALGYFGPGLVSAASDQKTLIIAAPNPTLVRPPKPGQSYGCDPIADANAFFDVFAEHRATVWTSRSASVVAIQISNDGETVSLAKAMNASIGVVDPEEFTVTQNGNYYLTAIKDQAGWDRLNRLRRQNDEDGVVIQWTRNAWHQGRDGPVSMSLKTVSPSTSINPFREWSDVGNTRRNS
jgi:hypothetical protein